MLKIIIFARYLDFSLSLSTKVFLCDILLIFFETRSSKKYTSTTFYTNLWSILSLSHSLYLSRSLSRFLVLLPFFWCIKLELALTIEIQTHTHKTETVFFRFEDLAQNKPIDLLQALFTSCINSIMWNCLCDCGGR